MRGTPLKQCADPDAEHDDDDEDDDDNEDEANPPKPSKAEQRKAFLSLVTDSVQRDKRFDIREVASELHISPVVWVPPSHPRYSTTQLGWSAKLAPLVALSAAALTPCLRRRR